LKTHVRILAWFYIVIFGMLLAIGAFLSVGVGMDADPAHRKAAEYIVWPFFYLSCFPLVPGLVTGIGLLRMRPWGRILMLGFSGLMLPLLPVGTVIGGYGFWVLLNEETRILFGGAKAAAASPALGGQSLYRPAIPSASVYSSPGYGQAAYPRAPVWPLLGVMAMVGAGFYLALKVGFATHHDAVPEPFQGMKGTVTAIVILVAGAAVLTTAAVRSGGVAGARSRSEAEKNFDWHKEARRLRAAELAANPATAKYAPLVEKGEEWSDADIAYFENPALTTTCPHLEPIERAMRAAGIEARRYRETDTSMTCRIDHGALERDFGVTAPVRYAEFYAGDRDSCDRPIAFLICDEHKSMIHTLHPDEGLKAKNAVVFPGAGG